MNDVFKVKTILGMTFVLTDLGSDNPRRLPSRAFYKNSHIQRVTIPDGFTIIGSEAFKDACNLNFLHLPDTLQLIEQSAFTNCSSLEVLNLPDDIREIDAKAFAGCRNLFSVSIPASLTKIGHGAFSGCERLSELTIWKGLIGEEKSATYTLSHYRHVPPQLQDLLDSAFDGCPVLRTICTHD